MLVVSRWSACVRRLTLVGSGKPASGSRIPKVGFRALALKRWLPEIGPQKETGIAYCQVPTASPKLAQKKDLTGHSPRASSRVEW